MFLVLESFPLSQGGSWCILLGKFAVFLCAFLFIFTASLSSLFLRLIYVAILALVKSFHLILVTVPSSLVEPEMLQEFSLGHFLLLYNYVVNLSASSTYLALTLLLIPGLNFVVDSAMPKLQVLSMMSVNKSVGFNFPIFVQHQGLAPEKLINPLVKLPLIRENAELIAPVILFDKTAVYQKHPVFVPHVPELHNLIAPSYTFFNSNIGDLNYLLKQHTPSKILLEGAFALQKDLLNLNNYGLYKTLEFAFPQTPPQMLRELEVSLLLEACFYEGERLGALEKSSFLKFQALSCDKGARSDLNRVYSKHSSINLFNQLFIGAHNINAGFSVVRDEKLIIAKICESPYDFSFLTAANKQIVVEVKTPVKPQGILYTVERFSASKSKVLEQGDMAYFATHAYYGLTPTTVVVGTEQDLNEQNDFPEKSKYVIN